MSFLSTVQSWASDKWHSEKELTHRILAVSKNKTVNQSLVKGSQLTHLSLWFRVHLGKRPCCCTCVFPAGHRCTVSHREKKRTIGSSLASPAHMSENTHSTATIPPLLGHLRSEMDMERIVIYAQCFQWSWESDARLRLNNKRHCSFLLSLVQIKRIHDCNKTAFCYLTA